MKFAAGSMFRSTPSMRPSIPALIHTGHRQNRFHSTRYSKPDYVRVERRFKCRKGRRWRRRTPPNSTHGRLRTPRNLSHAAAKEPAKLNPGDLRWQADRKRRLACLRHQVRGAASRLRLFALSLSLVSRRGLLDRSLYGRHAYHHASRIQCGSEWRSQNRPSQRRWHDVFLPLRQNQFPRQPGIGKGQSNEISSQGVSSNVFFRDDKAALAQTYGDETGKIMTFFTGEYGLALQANLTLVETEPGAVTGDSAPGIVFLHQVNLKTSEHQGSRESALAAVVGHAGFAIKSQLPLATERARPLLGIALHRTHCRSGPDGNGPEKYLR